MCERFGGLGSQYDPYYFQNPQKRCSFLHERALSPSQAKAVTDTGVLLILAGPGSGKTRVITEKIFHLIDDGVKPENILALTFSDKAAHEMPGRLEKQLNTSDLTISTFHAFALPVLQDNVPGPGLSSRRGSSAGPTSWCGAGAYR